MQPFDAVITLNDHHIALSGLSGAEAIAAVRRAVEAMPGARQVRVEAESYPLHLPGWVLVYPIRRGRSSYPLRRAVEDKATAALAGEPAGVRPPRVPGSLPVSSRDRYEPAGTRHAWRRQG